jgi:hypothetical protein
MARIRTIKPEFFTSEDIVGLSPLARLLYVALWCEADKEGRLVWKPATFKLRYLPGDSVDVVALCKELTDGKLVILYGEGYAYIPSFKAHQHINPRESQSQLPDPSATRGARVGTRQPRASDAQGGREGKGREGNELTPNGVCPADAEPDGQPKAYEVPECPHEAIVGLYHETLPSLPHVEVWSETRRGYLRQRWREVCADQKYTKEQGFEWFRDFFGLVAKSDFLTGRCRAKPGERAFLADLEWLVRPQNFVKVIEGKYNQ